MKKFLLCVFFAICLIIQNTTASAEENLTRRIVLVEEFTNLGCQPCAAAAPVVDSLLVDRLGDIAAIKYHVNWPYGSDEFYKADAADINARISSYDVSSVPSVFVDGQITSANARSMDTFIDAGLQKSRRIGFTISSTLSDDNALSINLHLEALEALESSRLRLYVCVTEEYVKLAKAAPNGEEECIYSCRKMLPTAQGEELGEQLAKGWTNDYQYSWTVNNFKNVANLGIVAFVQDTETHEVIDAVYAPRNAGASDAATILRVNNTPDRICSPHYSATLKIRNTGANPMQEAKLNMEVNGQLQQTLWTGNLAYLESEIVELPDFTDFSLNESGENTARFWISEVNGKPDTDSGVQEVEFASSKTAEYSVQLTFYTDKKPEESSWTLYDADGNVVTQSQPYTESRHKYVEILPIYSDGCYMIDFVDAGGDGIVGSYGNGWFSLTQVLANGTKKTLIQSDYDNAGISVHFGLKNAATSAIEQLPTNETKSTSIRYYNHLQQILIYNHNNETFYNLNAAAHDAADGHGAVEQ